jgi:hypothetical protein
MAWLVYWPFSAAWTIIHDPVKKAFKWIYRRLQGVYESIAIRLYRGIDDRPKLLED